MKNFIFHTSYLISIVLMIVVISKLQIIIEGNASDRYVARFLDRTSSWRNAGSETEQTGTERNGSLPDLEDPGNFEGLSEGTKEQMPASENAAGKAECDIRVLLSGEQGYAQQKFRLTFPEDYYIQNGQEVYYGEADTSLDESNIFELFAKQNEDGAEDILIGVWKDGGWDMAASWQLEKGHQEAETYQGILMISKAENGFYLINILPLEEYLYYVLPSEMPSDFPEEALKAQAVCARSYALLQMKQGRLREFGADVDDTSSFQVYHARGTSDAAVLAVNATRGQYMSCRGEPIEAFYYACSCGHSATADIWRNGSGGGYSYLTYHEYDDLEKASPWFRWSYYAREFDIGALKSGLLSILEQHGESVSIYRNGEQIAGASEKKAVIGEMNSIQNMEISQRLTGNVADQLHIVSGGYHIYVESEYDIRRVLTAESYTLVKQDMSESTGLSMVPSGFFDMEVLREENSVTGFVLKGGGFGHGVGMSQYGAKYLAEEGRDYKYILTYYYENVTIETLLN